jgi:hypothetical protein
MSRPLRSARITQASPLLRAGPPARAATVLSTSPFQRLGALPLAPAICGRSISARLPVFPHASRRPGSRHLHAGHRLASKRVSARLIPGQALLPRFRCRFPLSTLQRWFTRVRLPGPRLTALTPPFPHRSAPRSSAKAPCGGLTPPPARAAPKGHETFISHAVTTSSHRPLHRRLLSVHTAQNASGFKAKRLRTGSVFGCSV